eukprot:Opistho-1_new@64539
MDEGKPLETFNIVVIGEGGVGKSAVTLKLIRNHFVEEYDPTIEDSYTKTMELDGINCNLEITDTAGQEEYRGLWGDKFMRNGEGFLVVYAITSKQSFEKVEPLVQQLLRVKDTSKVPVVVIGNKLDLASDREVPKDEADRKCKSLGIDAFLETSAKEGVNIEQAFTELVRAMRKHRLSQGVKVGGRKGTDEEGESTSKKGGCCVVM